MFFNNFMTETAKAMSTQNESQQFDSAGDLKQAVEAHRMSRQEQATHEHFRFDAVEICSLLLDASEDGFENTTPSALLDDLITEKVDGFDEHQNDATDLLVACIHDFLESLGVDSSLISEMFEDDEDVSDSAIEQACQTALANLPDDDELSDFIDAFVFGDDDVMFDSASKAKAQIMSKFNRGDKKGKTVGQMSTRTLGENKVKVQYKAQWAMRKGKKVLVNKRVNTNTHIQLSAKQKAHLNKIREKAKSGLSIAKRTASLKKGYKLGLYKKV